MGVTYLNLVGKWLASNFKCQQIYSEALQDLEKLETEIRTTYELNPAMMIG